MNGVLKFLFFSIITFSLMIVGFDCGYAYPNDVSSEITPIKQAGLFSKAKLKLAELNKKNTLAKVNDSNDLIDSLVYYDSPERTEKFKHQYTYDADGNKLTALSTKWDSGVIYYSWLSEYAYDTNGNLQSSLSKSLDTDTQLWNNENLRSYTYDVNNNLIVELNQRWDNDGQTWKNDERISFTYTNNIPTTFVSEEWDTDSGDWVFLYKLTESYNDQGKIIGSLAEIWDTDNQGWRNYQKSTFTFDSNDNLVKSLLENWDNTNLEWYDYNINSYTYDQNNNEITYLYETWMSWCEKWAKNRGTNSFDASGNILIQTDESWDSDSDSWSNNSKYTYTYDANGNTLTEICQFWNTDSVDWRNRSKNVYTYNSNNKVLCFVEQDWNDDTQSWDDFERQRYAYASNDLMDYGVAELNSAGTWVPWGEYFEVPIIGYEVYCYEIFIYYRGATSIKNGMASQPATFSVSQNYPNPFNPSTTISYTVAKKSEIRLSVYNSLGQEIAVLAAGEQAAGSYSVNFNAINLSSGVYFYKMISGTQQQTMRMLLVK